MNGKVYIGQTVDLAERAAQHQRNPPPRMVADMRAHQPFDRCWKMEALSYRISELGADKEEARLISKYSSDGDWGYNILPGAPRTVKRVWGMIASQQRRKGKMK